MDTNTDNHDKERLAETLAKLNDRQKELYDSYIQLREANGIEPTDRYRLAIASTIAKDMPPRETKEEIKDKTTREDRLLGEEAIKEARQPAAKTVDGIIDQAEKDVKQEWQRSAQQTLSRDGR